MPSRKSGKSICKLPDQFQIDCKNLCNARIIASCSSKADARCKLSKVLKLYIRYLQ